MRIRRVVSLEMNSDCSHDLVPLIYLVFMRRGPPQTEKNICETSVSLKYPYIQLEQTFMVNS
jgi:hypothetical protein